MASGSIPHTLSPWQRLKIVLAPEHGDLWVVFIYGVAVSILLLAVPIATQAVVNTAAFGTVVQPLVVLTFIVLGTMAIAGALRVLKVIVAELIQWRLFTRMSIDLAYRLPRTRVETYDTHRGTELVNRFLDVMTIQKSTALILLDGFSVLLQTAIGMVLLTLYHPILLGFALLLLSSMLGVIFGLGRGAVRTAIDASYAKYSVVAWLEELARNPIVFKGFGGSRHAMRRADATTQEYLATRKAHFRVLLRQIIGTLVVQAIASALLLGLGGWLVSRQQLTLGQLVAAELVVTPVVASFAKFGKFLETFYDLLAAVDKVGHLFDLPLERTGGEALPAPPPRPVTLALRNVTFAYPGRAPSLRDLSLTLEPGGRVAVVGPNGSGKSTLVDVVLGLRAPLHGAVELDGVDLKDLSLDQVRVQVGLVRGIELFDGTLLENVRVGREELGLHEVREALAAVGLLKDLSEMPEGLSTRMSGAQSPLSTGQAHRLMIARALVGRPRLLVLDESIDSIDADTRAHVLDTLFAADAPWTLLLTTHISEMTARCDRVYRLEGGHVVEVRER
jgi:putative ABC transport system ATP-binding protein